MNDLINIYLCALHNSEHQRSDICTEIRKGKQEIESYTFRRHDGKLNLNLQKKQFSESQKVSTSLKRAN